MLSGMKRGWRIAVQSWQVLRTDLSMLPFPFLSAVASTLLLLSFLAPVFLSPDLADWLANAPKGQGQGHEDNSSARAVITAATGAFYLINYFIVVFFNTALAACAVRRMQGEDSTMGYGLRVACSRLPQIIGWVLLASSIGVILRALSNRSAMLGKIVVALVGAAWTIAVCLVVPTIVVEGLGPVAALKRSSSLMVSSWGEGLSGSVGLGFLGVLLWLFGVGAVVSGLCIVASTHSAIALGATFAFALLYFPAVICVSSALRQIFIVGLYLYAADKRVPVGFSADTLEGAFSPKR